MSTLFFCILISIVALAFFLAGWSVAQKDEINPSSPTTAPKPLTPMQLQDPKRETSNWIKHRFI